MRDKQSNSNIQFTFDKVLDPESTQQEIYEAVAKSIVEGGLAGINGTIFAYGQTSSGKTHTCIGPNFNDSEKKGLLPRIVTRILEQARIQSSTLQFRTKVSMVEIYNQRIKDLLDISKDNLKIRSNKTKGIYIEDVTQKLVVDEQQAFMLLKKGMDNRSVGCTNMNAESSRSHMAFLITIYQKDLIIGSAKTAKITLIDLAGSQKLSKTGAEGKLLQQAKQINKSLCTLGKVINVLCDNKIKNSHIPYRDSKLTRLLQESLGGNSSTSLIVNISPNSSNESETISSLRFGNRAKSIENKPTVNMEYTVQQLAKLLEKAELKIRDQQKVIESYEKKKRVGGYGCFSNSLTLHLIGDESQSDNSKSSTQSTRQVQSKTRVQGKSLILDSNQQINESLLSRQSLDNKFQRATSQKKGQVGISKSKSFQAQNQSSSRKILSSLGNKQKNVTKQFLRQNTKSSNIIKEDYRQTNKDNQEPQKQHLLETRLFNEKISELTTIIFEEQAKYGQLLVKHTTLSSQTAMQKQTKQIFSMIIDRKNSVIQHLKSRMQNLQLKVKQIKVTELQSGPIADACD